MGKDLIGRLQSKDDDQFRSAMAECLACWFFGGKLKIPLIPRPKGIKNKVLEFIAKYSDGEMRVEVKAPLRERKGQVWSGNDSDLVKKSLGYAERKFPENGKNLLCIAHPGFPRSILGDRSNFIKALFGQDKITWQINMNTSETTTPDVQFFPDGKFLRDRHSDGKRLKPDGLPYFTRVSGVIFIEEGVTFTPDSNLRGKNQVYIVVHKVFVIHNPHAKNPLPQDIWADYPQFIRVGDTMKWSDS